VLCALFLLLPATPAVAAPAWLAPVDLTAAGESARTAPQVAVDPGGDAVAVWKGHNGADEVIEASSRTAGGSWQAPVDLSAAGYDASEPQVAVDAAGEAVVLWKDSGGTNTIIEAASRTAGGGWQAPVELSAAGRNASEPQVALDAGGDVVAVWGRSDGTNLIVQAASRPAGAGWEAPVDLSAAGQETSEPQVAIDAAGDAVAAWKADGAHFIVQAASRPAGAGWQVPVDLSATGQGAYEPQVAIGADGDAVAVWKRYNGSNYVVDATGRPAGGSWEVPVDLSAAGQNTDAPQVAVDSGGDAVAVWEGSDIVEAASRPAGGSWQASVDLSATGQGAYEPQVAIDPGGDAVAVWENETNDIGEAASRPAGGSWQAPVDLSAGEGADAPQVAVDSGGDAVAVWEGYEGGFTVQAATYDATGPQLRSLSIPGAGTVGQRSPSRSRRSTAGRRSVRSAGNSATEPAPAAPSSATPTRPRATTR
jgi:hypothetical protein